MLITSALDIFTVIANAEQMPSTCTVMGLLSFSGSVISARFFLLKSPSEGFTSGAFTSVLIGLRWCC